MNTIDYVIKGKNESRILNVRLGDKTFSTPSYFPSISSAATRIQLDSLISFCISEKFPRLLISAYDLYDFKNKRKKIIRLLKNYQKQNFLFIDSGTFERHWLKKKWSYQNYHKIIKEISGDIYSSFDEIPKPDENVTSIIKKTLNYAKKSSKISDSYCSTVVHGNTPSQLIQIIDKLSKKDDFYTSIIAIPERDCGKTLQTKITTIMQIRKILNKTHPSSMMHILGCGNPLSLAMYAFAGADSFDSIDWSRWVINPDTLQFMDYSHIELINCKCEICKKKTLDTINKGLLHNLLFYQKFTQEIQENILQNKSLNFLKPYLDRKIFSKIVKFF